MLPCHFAKFFELNKTRIAGLIVPTPSCCFSTAQGSKAGLPAQSAHGISPEISGPTDTRLRPKRAVKVRPEWARSPTSSQLAGQPGLECGILHDTWVRAGTACASR